MTIFDALISHVPGRSSPDAYDFQFGRPSNDFVVSRDIDGNVLSRYADLVWDRTPYSFGETTKLYFKFWDGDATTENRIAIVEVLHWIMFLMMWRNPSGRSLSTKTLNSILVQLRGIARRADAIGIGLKEAMADRAIMAVTSHAGSSRIFKVLGMLQFLGPEITNFEVSADILPSLRDVASEYEDSIKQTAPIPTRIYSTILSNLSGETRKIGNVIDKLVAAYSEIKNDRGEGGSKFDYFIGKFDLTEFWASKDVVPNISGFSRVLREIQSVLSVQIQAYTGMRAQEARYLPYDCLEETRRVGDWRVHYIIKGTVTKHTSGKESRTQWITIEAAAEAIRIAQQLALAIYSAQDTIPNHVNSRKNGSFLFPRVDCDGKHRSSTVLRTPNRLIMTKRMLTLLCPVIQEEDQKELYAIDPHREWCREIQYAVGSQWHLHTHQLRRSLALYAQSSGLVSLPSLKRQLQHITLEMSLYYAKGSAFSQNFIGKPKNREEKHFGEEWQETQPISQFFAYVAAVILSDELEMFGGHGQWLKARKRDENGQIFLNRSQTMKSFKKGEMAYRPTPLGGCVNPGSCDKTPINVLSVECIGTDCKNLIASTKKVERIIFIKMNTIRKLKEADPTSAEVRIEEAELNTLQTGLARAKKLN